MIEISQRKANQVRRETYRQMSTKGLLGQKELGRLVRRGTMVKVVEHNSVIPIETIQDGRYSYTLLGFSFPRVKGRLTCRAVYERDEEFDPTLMEDLHFS